MNTIEIIASIIFGVALLVTIFGFTKPQIATIVKSVEINASPTTIFEQVNSLKLYVDNWSPWTQKDPNIKHEFNTISQGKGSKYHWKGDLRKVGNGSVEIIESTENEKVIFLYNFGDRAISNVSIELTQKSSETLVTWTFSSDAGLNPLKRIFNTLINKLMGADFEKGLQNLKTFCESNTK